jgi:hypothetical protein
MNTAGMPQSSAALGIFSDFLSTSQVIYPAPKRVTQSHKAIQRSADSIDEGHDFVFYKSDRADPWPLGTPPYSPQPRGRDYDGLSFHIDSLTLARVTPAGTLRGG